VHDILTNPMWASLTSTHAGFSAGSGNLKRFVPDVAPFCAVEQDGAVATDTQCLRPGETVYFLGAVPRLPPHCTVVGESAVLQMVLSGTPPAGGVDDAQTLGPGDNQAMLGLTALVYPEFFRPRTAALGKYIGRYAHGQLAAMVGQRLACPGYREISAVCTHPEHRGQGHAGRLIGQTSRAILADGAIPFLHVSASNKSAWALYENLGFAACRELQFVKVLVG
jgi:ribosomal protein S18 acetylase RimI-like enzyme